MTELAQVADIPAAYVHPSEKQCSYTYTHPSAKQCNYTPDLSNVNAALLNGMSASQIIAKATSSTSIKTEWFAGTLATGRHEEWTSDHTFSFVPTMFVGSEWHDGTSFYEYRHDVDGASHGNCLAAIECLVSPEVIPSSTLWQINLNVF